MIYVNTAPDLDRQYYTGCAKKTVWSDLGTECLPRPALGLFTAISAFNLIWDDSVITV